MTIMDRACYERGCACYDNRVDKDGVEVVAQKEVEAEREACARACEEMRPSKAEYDQRFYDGCTFSAAAIRARGSDPMPLFDDWDKD